MAQIESMASVAIGPAERDGQQRLELAAGEVAEVDPPDAVVTPEAGDVGRHRLARADRPDQEVQASVEELADQRGGGGVEQLEVIDQEDDPAALAPVLDRLRDLREQRDRVAAVEQDPSREQMGDRAERNLPRALARHCSHAPPTAASAAARTSSATGSCPHLVRRGSRRRASPGSSSAVRMPSSSAVTADEGPSGAEPNRRPPTPHAPRSCGSPYCRVPSGVLVHSVAQLRGTRPPRIEHIVLNTCGRSRSAQSHHGNTDPIPSPPVPPHPVPARPARVRLGRSAVAHDSRRVD